MSERTIRHHLEKHIRPVWRAEMAADLHVDLAKTAEIERAAWKRHERTGDPSDLAMAKWAIEYRAKVFGHYSAAKVSVNQGGEIRVAGQTPAEFDAETVRLLLERIQERRKTQEAVKARWN